MTLHAARDTTLADAKSQFNLARSRLREAVKTAYPVGARVHVTIGTARIIGVVQPYIEHYVQPDDVVVLNEATGARRCFNACRPDHEPCRL